MDIAFYQHSSLPTQPFQSILPSYVLNDFLAVSSWVRVTCCWINIWPSSSVLVVSNFRLSAGLFIQLLNSATSSCSLASASFADANTVTSHFFLLPGIVPFSYKWEKWYNGNSNFWRSEFRPLLRPTLCGFSYCPYCVSFHVSQGSSSLHSTSFSAVLHLLKFRTCFMAVFQQFLTLSVRRDSLLSLSTSLLHSFWYSSAVVPDLFDMVIHESECTWCWKWRTWHCPLASASKRIDKRVR